MASRKKAPVDLRESILAAWQELGGKKWLVELGKGAELAWDKIAQSVRLSDETVRQLEQVIVKGYEANRAAKRR